MSCPLVSARVRQFRSVLARNWHDGVGFDPSSLNFSMPFRGFRRERNLSMHVDAVQEHAREEERSMGNRRRRSPRPTENPTRQQQPNAARRDTEPFEPTDASAQRPSFPSLTAPLDQPHRLATSANGSGGSGGNAVEIRDLLSAAAEMLEGQDEAVAAFLEQIGRSATAPPDAEVLRSN